MRRKPKPDKAYWFVKSAELGVIAKLFMRDSDGGGLLYPDLNDVEYDGTWEELWDYLAHEGFVEERDAKRQEVLSIVVDEEFVRRRPLSWSHPRTPFP